MSRGSSESAPTGEVQRDPVPNEIHGRDDIAGEVEAKEGRRGGRKQPERIQTEANLTWPPTNGDLERLYLRDHLSAAKISDLYGLKYENPKCGETLILYHLKHKGIARRGAADHLRRVTEEMVDEWVRRYEAGESLKQIAGEGVGAPTVFVHLRKRGLKLRDKVEEVIRLNTIHKKTPFSGDTLEKVYLLGFARGDLWITTHGRAVRARGGSTHPAFTQLFRELFGRYGPIYVYPKEAKLTGYEWSMDADLDGSFRFLLERDMETFEKVLSDDSLFLSYLAGFFDAEGSVYYHKKGVGGAFELSIANMDVSLLETLNQHLQGLGYSSKLSRTSQDPEKRNIRGADHIWHISIWRHDDVRTLLTHLPLMHSEKTAKRELAVQLPSWPSRMERSTILGKWRVLLTRITREVEESIEEARVKMELGDQSGP